MPTTEGGGAELLIFALQGLFFLGGCGAHASGARRIMWSGTTRLDIWMVLVFDFFVQIDRMPWVRKTFHTCWTGTRDQSCVSSSFALARSWPFGQLSTLAFWQTCVRCVSFGIVYNK